MHELLSADIALVEEKRLFIWIFRNKWIGFIEAMKFRSLGKLLVKIDHALENFRPDVEPGY